MALYTVVVKTTFDSHVIRVRQPNEDLALWQALKVGCRDPWLDQKGSADPDIYAWTAQGGLFPEIYDLRALVLEGWHTAQQVVDAGILDRFYKALDMELIAMGVKLGRRNWMEGR